MSKLMDEIREDLINYYNASEGNDAEKIKLLLRSEVVLRCKCPNCGEKFTPEEGMKLSKTIF